MTVFILYHNFDYEPGIILGVYDHPAAIRNAVEAYRDTNPDAMLEVGECILNGPANSLILMVKIEDFSRDR